MLGAEYLMLKVNRTAGFIKTKALLPLPLRYYYHYFLQ